MAYTDESSTRDPDFRSIACVSFPAEESKRINTEIGGLLKVGEFKWQDLREGRMRDQALALVDYALGVLGGALRVDVLLWSMHDDRRRGLVGRDDMADLERMYYWLLKTVMDKRWPRSTLWDIHPDEHTEIDWATMFDVVGYPRRLDLSGRLLPDDDIRRLHTRSKLRTLRPVESRAVPVVQLADLFAGIAVFSWKDQIAFGEWCREVDPQQSLLGAVGSQKRKTIQVNRCEVLRHLLSRAKQASLGVGVSAGGLRTLPPSRPLSFWKWEPQRSEDRAPVRSGRATTRTP